MSLRTFPFKKARDLRSAMAKGLVEYLQTLTFTFPATAHPQRLAVVLDEWAEFEKKALASGATLPAAAVLPDRALPDDDAFTPRILEETWTGGDPGVIDPATGRPRWPVGQGTGVGYALFAVAEKVVPMLVLARTASKPQRQAIISSVEDAFFDLGVKTPGVPYPEPGRWGRVVTLHDYYDRPCRFTFKGHQLLDAEGPAKENRWMVQFEILAEAKQVAVAKVASMDARVQLVLDDEAAPR